MRSFVILGALALAACGGHSEGGIDDVVGSACASDRDCSHQCFMSGDLPGGFCSLSCLNDNDCPGDTLCIAESDGICMFECPPFDCARLGANWRCRDRDRLNGGNARVCSGD